MKTSTPRPPNNQPAMWNWIGDRPLTKMAMVRPWVGDFFEQATISLTGGVRLKTVAGSLCPDVKLPSQWYAEVKSIGGSRARIIYKHRMEKYEQFMKQGNKLVYVFWLHNCKATEYKTLFSLREALANSVLSVAVVSAKEVHRVAATCKERFTVYQGTKAEPSRRVMKPAYTIPPKKIMAWMSGQSTIGYVDEVYGYAMPPIILYERVKQWATFPN